MKTFWIIGLALVQTIIVFPNHIWKEVSVAVSMLEGPFVSSSQRYITQYQWHPDVICGLSCSRQSWCTLWCPNSSNQTCLLSNALVSPLHITNSTNAYKCYTYQEKDFVVGGTGTSSYVGFYPTRNAQNLVQGIYNYNDLLTCCVTYGSLNPWMLIKLKNPQTIHEIRITTQPYDLPQDLPNNVEIRVGTSLPAATGNFTNYRIFGIVPNQTSMLTTYSFLNTNGVENIQYISLQRYSTTDGMGICQVIAW